MLGLRRRKQDAENWRFFKDGQDDGQNPAVLRRDRSAAAEADRHGERIPLVFHRSVDRVGSDSTMAAAGTQRGYDRQNSA